MEVKPEFKFKKFSFFNSYEINRIDVYLTNLITNKEYFESVSATNSFYIYLLIFVKKKYL